MALAPETIIMSLLLAFKEVIKMDWELETDKTKSFLYKFTNDNEFDSESKYYEICKELLFRDKPNELEIDLFFNLEKATVPHIHIVLPGEMPDYDGIGVDEGFEETEENEEDGELQAFYNRTFTTEFNIIFTSTNKIEVLALYHLFKCIIVSCFDSFEHNGLQNLKISGKDIQFSDYNAPDRFFAKSISLNCFYDLTVPKIDKDKLFRKLGIGDITQILESEKITTTINKIIYEKIL